ncbi:MAG: ribosome assembly cofactor RimP [Cytophagaceae bacterium]|jgi:ribosome maturation factor RimP|nr:ribosome assembly cofactor RimP [Cytophagaceae bacterium]
MITQSAIVELIGGTVENDGYFLVSVEVKPSNAITVFIDREDGVSIDYCVKISRLIEGAFDREVEDYSLEVSSPGIGLPFKVLGQYRKNTGKEVDVVVKDGRKISGILTDANEEGFTVKEEKMIRPEGQKKKELQITDYRFNYIDVKSVIEIIKF